MTLNPEPHCVFGSSFLQAESFIEPVGVPYRAPQCTVGFHNRTPLGARSGPFCGGKLKGPTASKKSKEQGQSSESRGLRVALKAFGLGRACGA